MPKRLKFVTEQWVLFMVRWQTWQARRFEIFESARHFRIESGRLIRISKLRRSLSGSTKHRKGDRGHCKGVVSRHQPIWDNFTLRPIVIVSPLLTGGQWWSRSGNVCTTLFSLCHSTWLPALCCPHRCRPTANLPWLNAQSPTRNWTANDGLRQTTDAQQAPETLTVLHC